MIIALLLALFSSPLLATTYGDTETGPVSVAVATGSISAFQGGTWTIATTPPASQVVTFTSGSYSNPFFVVSTNTVVSTGSITAFQGGTWTITPPAVQYVTLSSGSFSNPFYTLSTNTVVSTGSITAFQGGAPWTFNVNGTTFTSSNPGYMVWTATNPVSVIASTIAVTNVNGQNLNVNVAAGTVAIGAGSANIGTINGSTVAIVNPAGGTLAVTVSTGAVTAYQLAGSTWSVAVSNVVGSTLAIASSELNNNGVLFDGNGHNVLPVADQPVNDLLFQILTQLQSISLRLLYIDSKLGPTSP